MELQCDVCFSNFDLDTHRPKNLPCGHTICKKCVLNPDLGKKCPTCRKDLEVDPGDLPDANIVIRMIEDQCVLPCKRPRREVTEQQRLQRGLEAGRKLVEALRLVVPKAVEALNRQLDTSVAHLRHLEEALEQHVQRGVAGDVGPTPEEQLQLAEQMEDSIRLLNTNRCSFVAQEEDGSTWKASVQLGGFGDILRPLLVQLREDYLLLKVDDVAVPATPAAYVGPPMFPTLSIVAKDLDKDLLKVDDILRDGQRWRDVRAIKGLQGKGSDKLLRVLAPHLPYLEELEISGQIESGVMEEVEKLSSLRRLKVQYDWTLKYPDLPLQLEELHITNVNENQLRRVLNMPRLCSVYFNGYSGANVTFPPSQHDTLQWMHVHLHTSIRAAMLSLIRAFASSLQELEIFSPVNDKKEYAPDFYHPELGQDLAACGLRALKRLVLQRPTCVPCPEVAACLLQRRTIRSFLPSSFEVVCGACHTPLS
ncbi:E3 ubiquitin-protein ligase TRIM32-like [Frankliniella occidentalis]|uniref:E3 ubiquitin-protein ligase TRIM32-like n=1 Tax=Frankliniella occidentalis TaxID=133901 RepID=A0A6J1SWW8_FRAOC|nr:E3 ubiquitin-protein ligase TRIM32-like [Frankliniella occidentalis]